MASFASESFVFLQHIIRSTRHAQCGQFSWSNALQKLHRKSRKHWIMLTTAPPHTDLLCLSFWALKPPDWSKTLDFLVQFSAFEIISNCPQNNQYTLKDLTTKTLKSHNKNRKTIMEERKHFSSISPFLFFFYPFLPLQKVWMLQIQLYIYIILKTIRKWEERRTLRWSNSILS